MFMIIERPTLKIMCHDFYDFSGIAGNKVFQSMHLKAANIDFVQIENEMLQSK